MDLFQQKRGLDLLYDLLIRGKGGDILRIPYHPSKTVLPEPVEEYYPRATPESRGVESSRLSRMLAALEQDKHVNVHAISVLCDGAVICEATARPYDRSLPHVSYSLCKSITGMAIGLLRDEGRITLDEPAYRYFPQADLPGRLGGRMRAITVRHLLTMASGVAFAETGSATDTEWVRAFFSSDVKFEPGSDFAYNSMNPYILSALVRVITGEGLVEYLRPRLFDPLHIRHIFWETCPRGIEKGGWGLYIAQEDMLKLGQLCLDEGVFEGSRLISREWLAEACTTQRTTPESCGIYDYGYQIWHAREGGSYLFNGMLGQNVWVCPQNRMVVAVNAGNVEFFQKSSMLAIIEQTLGCGYRRPYDILPPDKRALRALRLREEHFYETRTWVKLLKEPGAFTRLMRRLRREVPHPLPAACAALSGKRFPLLENNSGILPLFVRLQQNNHTKGLRAIRPEKMGERFFVTFDEGEGALYRIEFGFYDYRPSLLEIGGERYRLCCAARFTVDEDGRALLMLHVVFPELAHERRFKLYYEEDPATLTLREVPGKELLAGLLRMSMGEGRSRGLMGFIQSRLNMEYFLMKAYEKFEPVLLSDTPAAHEREDEQALLEAAVDAEEGGSL